MRNLIYGIHTVESLLKHDSKCFLCVYVLDSHLNRRLQSLLHQLKECNIPIRYCHRYYLNCKVKSDSHQGIVAEVYRKNIFTGKDILSILEKYRKTSLLLLVLDNIVDPRNLGACFRCAGAFGVDIVVISKHNSVGFSGAVWKVASGVADQILFIRVTNLVCALQLLKQHNIWVVGTVLQKEFSIFNAKLSSPRLAIVVGSEKSGIRFLTRKHCDELISIPMCNSLASLNVSVATGICLYEILKHRLCYISR